MKQVLVILFLIMCMSASGQQLTEVKSVTTISVTGKILFIDSLCDMTSQNNHHFGNWSPYYLVLINIDTINPMSISDHRLVFRTTNIRSLNIGAAENVLLKMTEYTKINIPSVDNTINTDSAIDSIINQVNKRNFVLSMLEKAPCWSYSLKEKPYVIFEQTSK